MGSAIGIKEGGILQHILAQRLKLNVYLQIFQNILKLDVTDLKLGNSIHAGDLKFDNFSVINSAEVIIATVTHPKVEKEAAPAEGEETKEPEVITKGKPLKKKKNSFKCKSLLELVIPAVDIKIIDIMLGSNSLIIMQKKNQLNLKLQNLIIIIAEGEIDSTPFLLVKPSSFVNNSGVAVLAVVQEHGYPVK